MSAPKVIGSDLSRLTLGHFNVFGSGLIRRHHHDYGGGLSRRQHHDFGGWIRFCFIPIWVFGSGWHFAQV